MGSSFPEGIHGMGFGFAAADMTGRRIRMRVDKSILWGLSTKEDTTFWFEVAISVIQAPVISGLIRRWCIQLSALSPLHIVY
jgi:hypothetical protein